MGHGQNMSHEGFVKKVHFLSSFFLQHCNVSTAEWALCDNQFGSQVYKRAEDWIAKTFKKH